MPIWNTLYNKYIICLESIQIKFLRAIQYRCYGNQISYMQLLNLKNKLTLEARRKQLEALLLYSLCHNSYDCPGLVNQICYCIPTRTHCRNPCRLFATNRCRTDAGKRRPLYSVSVIFIYFVMLFYY